MPLTLEIVTPEARVYSDTVDNVVIPTVQGQIGVLPGHIPLLRQVDHGELLVSKGNTMPTTASMHTRPCLISASRSHFTS